MGFVLCDFRWQDNIQAYLWEFWLETQQEHVVAGRAPPKLNGSDKQTNKQMHMAV